MLKRFVIGLFFLLIILSAVLVVVSGCGDSNKVNSLQSQITQLKEENATLNTQVSDLDKRVTKLSEANLSQNVELLNQKTHIDGQVTEITQSEDRITVLEGKIQTIETELTNSNPSTDGKIITKTLADKVWYLYRYAVMRSVGTSGLSIMR